MNETQPGRNGGQLNRGNKGNRGRRKPTESFGSAEAMNFIIGGLRSFAEGEVQRPDGQRPSYRNQLDAIRILIKLARDLPPDGPPLPRSAIAEHLVYALNAEPKIPWRTRARVFDRVCQGLHIDATMPRDPRSLVPKRPKVDLPRDSRLPVE